MVKSLFPKSKMQLIISLLLIAIIDVNLIATVGVIGAYTNQTKSNQQVNQDLGPSTVKNIVQTSDGGYAFLGDFGGRMVGGGRGGIYWSADCYLSKLDALGNLQWRKTYSQILQGNPKTFSQTKDGGYVIFGYNHDGYPCLVKADSKGSVIWSKYYSTSYDYQFNGLATNDGGILIYGNTPSYSTASYTYGVYIQKLDSQGNKVWNQTFSNPNLDIIPTSVVQLDNGNYAVIGKENSYLWYALLSNSGKVLSDKGYYFDDATQQFKSETINIESSTVTLSKANGGNSIITVQHSQYNYNTWEVESYIILLCYNQKGELKWQHTINLSGVSLLGTFQSSGGYIGVGVNNNSSSLFVIKTDESGATVWMHSPSKPDSDCQLQNYAVTNDGGVILAGTTTYLKDPSFPTVWMTKFNSLGTQTTLSGALPFSSVITIVFIAAIIAADTAASVGVVLNYNKQEKLEETQNTT
jgi:hypothetical protein